MFIQTEKGRCLDVKDCRPPWVEPYTQNQWGLYTRATTGTYILIAAFDSDEDATAALLSLKDAIARDRCWDALAFSRRGSFLRVRSDS